jgi:hypothetical protein
MQKPRGTTIEDLETLGQQLVEEHLVLAAGGRMKGPTYRPDFSIVNGQVVLQFIPD